MSIKFGNKKIPSSAGVYFFKGPKGLVLYIGKASNLKKRLASYRRAADTRILKMMETATDLDWQETGSEVEALILESQLIKKHHPPFNIMLRDDKQYFFVGITKEKFPIIFLTHQPRVGRMADLPKADFVGPFTEGISLKATLKLLKKIFPFCTCKQKHNRHCLNYHIGNCLGFCCLKDPEFTNKQKADYKKNIKAIKNILNGKRILVLKNLEKEMEKSAKEDEFEKAIELRGKIENLKRVFENAKVIKELAGRSKVLEDLKKYFQLSKIPQRIEGYDISNIQGRFATGSMVVFVNGQPDKNEYRKFKIRTVPPDQGGDVAMLKEMLVRRFKHSEWPLSDLIIIDGGKGQLNAALEIIHERKLNIPVISLTKDKKHRGHHIFTSTKKVPITLSELPAGARNIILHVDSEAHRFAISYYRKLHRKTI